MTWENHTALSSFSLKVFHRLELPVLKEKVVKMWQRTFLNSCCRQLEAVNSKAKFSTTVPCQAIIMRTRLRVVDNSTLGASAIDRPPYCIHVYNKQRVGKLGDRILVAIKGEKKQALVVGVRRPGDNMTPRFDTNNIIILEETGNPTGTRITVPIPSALRKRTDLSKVFAIATKFV